MLAGASVAFVPNLCELGVLPRNSSGENFDLNGAVFHGYPRLCQFLIEQGANVNKPLLGTGETPLHRAAAFGSEQSILRLLCYGVYRA